MPFKSKAQMRWMFANDPEMAKRWAKHTENVNKIPEKVKQALATLKLTKPVNGSPSSTVKPDAPAPSVAPNYSQQYGSSLQEAVKQRGGALAASQNKQGSFLAKLAEGMPVAGVTTIPPPGTQYQPSDPPIVPLKQDAPVETPAVNTTKQNKSTTPGITKIKPTEDWYNQALPGSIKNRMQSNRPEDLQHATVIHNLSPFNRSTGVTAFSADSNEAVTSKDIDSLHNFHNERFKDFVNKGTGGTETDTNAYEEGFPAGSPRVFDLISGKAGTPEQQQTAKSFLSNLEQRRSKINSPYMVQAVANARTTASNYEKMRQDRAAFDANTRQWTGLDIPTVDKMNGPLSVALGTSGNEKSQNRGWLQGSPTGESGFVGNTANRLGEYVTSPAGLLLPIGGAITGASRLIAPAARTVFGARIAARASPYLTPVLPYAATAARDVANMELKPAQLGNVAAGLAGLAGGSDVHKDALKSYAQMGGQLAYGMYPGAKQWAGGLKSILTSNGLPPAMGLVNVGMGGKFFLNSKDQALEAFNKAPTFSEIRRGVKNDSAPEIGGKSDYANSLVSPDYDDAPNTLPRWQDLGDKLKGSNPNSLAGDFNLGQQMSGIEDRLARLSSLPPDKQIQEKADIDRSLAQNLGSNLEEYSQYTSTKNELVVARQNFQKAEDDFMAAHEQTAGGLAGDIDSYNRAESKYLSSKDELSNYQERAAIGGLPIMTKALDKRYEREVKPIIDQYSSQDASKKYADWGESIKNKIQQGQALTEDDAAFMKTSYGHLNTLKDYSYDKAKLEFMRKGTLTPEMDELLSDKSPEGIKTLNQLFSGKPEPVLGKDGKPIMQVFKHPDTGQNIEVTMMQNSNVLVDTLQQNMGKQLRQYRLAGASGPDWTTQNTSASSAVPQEAKTVGQGGVLPPDGSTAIGGVSSDTSNTTQQLSTDPGYVDQAVDFVHNKILGGMQPWEKWLVYGGVALSAVGVISSMFEGAGDDDDDDDDDDSGGGDWMKWLGLLGAVGLPVANYFGYNLSSLFGGAASQSPPVAGAPGASPVAGAPGAAPVAGAPGASPVAGAPVAAPVAGATAPLPPYNPGKNTPAQINAELSKLNRSANRNERTVAQNYAAEQFAEKTKGVFEKWCRPDFLKIIKGNGPNAAQDIVNLLGASRISLEQAKEFMRYPDETLAALDRAGVR